MPKILINKLRKISKSEFVRNVIMVATGTAGAQAITIIFSPVVTRLYGPEAFGLLGSFLAILAMLTTIAALTYPIAIVLPKSDADAKGIAKLSAILALGIASIATILLLTTGSWLAQTLNLEAISGFLLLIPLAMLFAAYQQIFTQWLIRKKQFRTTARVAIIQALIINSAKVGIGCVHPVSAVLIVISTISYAFHSVLLWAGIQSNEAARPNNDERTGTIHELTKRYRDFPFYRAPQVLLNAISQGLPVIIIATHFGASTAGFWALSKSVLAAPAELIGNSVGNVFYPQAVELYEKQANLKFFLLKTSCSLLLIGITVFLPIIIFGPWLFSFIFGSEWNEAGAFARWVSLWMIFSLASRPVISIIPIANLQKIFLYIELIFTSMKIAALYVGFVFDFAMISVALFCLISCFFYMLLFLIVWKKI